MDTSIKCECGNDRFWYFGNFARCPECGNEFMQTISGRKKNIENWMRRFNHETHTYGNWEYRIQIMVV